MNTYILFRDGFTTAAASKWIRPALIAMAIIATVLLASGCGDSTTPHH